tara:strand:- start:9780 stop:10517 length:738 start_codon:yes stop_codon:yes gene_type:complete
MNLENKIILVTGGSGQLGKEIISNIIENNGIAINLDIKCDNDIKKGSIRCDVTNENSIKKSIEKVLSFHGKIDGLVNNAYPTTDDWGDKLEDVSNESFINNVEMQLSNVFSITKPILQIMKDQKSGSIVNIASIYGMVGNDFSIYEGTEMTSPVAYSAIKGGVISLNRYFASYFGPYNVRSNCVSPGGIYNNQQSKFIKNYNDKVPLRRMGEPNDIAPLVSFLLSDNAKYITGQNIAVDGGWTSI